MQKCILMLATSAFILACGGTAATAQQGPMMQQQAQPQQQQERTPQGAQMPRRGARSAPSFECSATGVGRVCLEDLETLVAEGG